MGISKAKISLCWNRNNTRKRKSIGGGKNRTSRKNEILRIRGNFILTQKLHAISYITHQEIWFIWKRNVSARYRARLSRVYGLYFLFPYNKSKVFLLLIRYTFQQVVPFWIFSPTCTFRRFVGCSPNSRRKKKHRRWICFLRRRILMKFGPPLKKKMLHCECKKNTTTWARFMTSPFITSWLIRESLTSIQTRKNGKYNLTPIKWQPPARRDDET